MQKAKSPKRGPGKAANRKAALSAQQTIPYLVMHPDGVCQLPGGLYTKTVEYEDINYSVASTEDQTAIFGGWSSFLNYFDSSLPFQLSFINRRSRSRSKYKVNIPPAQDDFDSIRAEFTSMLKNQIAKSNNGIERSKYITFGLPAEGIAEARPRLERVEADVTGNLKRLGVPSAPMDGQERLALLHSQMHPGSREPFRFSWQDIPGRAWEQRTLLPRTASTSGNPGHSASVSIGALHPTCRFWRPSSLTSSWRRSWSWMRK